MCILEVTLLCVGGGKPLPPGPIQPQLLDLASAVFTLRPGPFPFNGLLHLLLIEFECPCKADNSYHMISQKKSLLLPT